MSEHEADSCPFHDLPPKQTVHLFMENGPVSVASAQRWCDDWHVAKAFETALGDWRERLVAEISNLSLGHLDDRQPIGLSSAQRIQDWDADWLTKAKIQADSHG